jgi:hypothetical protein
MIDVRQGTKVLHAFVPELLARCKAYRPMFLAPCILMGLDPRAKAVAGASVRWLRGELLS